MKRRGDNFLINYFFIRFTLAFTLLFLFTSPQSLFSQEVLKVDIKGQILNEDNKNIAGAAITLLLENKEIKKTITANNGKFEFTVDFNKEYILKASKEGFYSKMIIISTVGITNVKYKGWDIILIEKVDGLEGEIFNKPVGRIFYNKETNIFDYDVEFQNKIKSELNLFQIELAEKRKENSYKVLDLKTEPSPENKNPSENKSIETNATAVYNNDTLRKDSSNELYASLNSNDGVTVNLKKSEPEQRNYFEKDEEMDDFSFNKEVIKGDNYAMIKITISRGGRTCEYRKIKFSYGTYFKKDNLDISEALFDYETQNF